MSSSEQIRWAGLAAILAGVMFLVFDLLDLAIGSDGFGPKNLGEEASTTVSASQSELTLLAGILLLVGLAGLYIQQLEDGGLLGMVGFLVAFCGTVMVVGGLTWLPLPLSGVPFSVAVVWLGYALFSGRDAQDE